MSNDRGDELTDYPNQGQADYNAGKYDPPHSITPLDGVVQSEHDFNRLVEDNQKYDEGYSNARNNR